MTSWLSKTTLQRLLDLAGLHCTTSERSGPFWQSMLHNFLSRPLSFLDWATSLLAGLPSCTIKPLQMIQNAVARLVFSEPKRVHITPLFTSLHWLPVAARIKFKTLTHAYRTATGSAPSYFHSLITIYIPSRSLRSVSERHLAMPSQRGTKSLSRTFSFTVPGWWNELPTLLQNAGSLSIFKRHLKTLSSSQKKKLCSLSLTLLFFP